MLTGRFTAATAATAATDTSPTTGTCTHGQDMYRRRGPCPVKGVEGIRYFYAFLARQYRRSHTHNILCIYIFIYVYYIININFPIYPYISLYLTSRAC